MRWEMASISPSMESRRTLAMPASVVCMSLSAGAFFRSPSRSWVRQWARNS